MNPLHPADPLPPLTPWLIVCGLANGICWIVFVWLSAIGLTGYLLLFTPRGRIVLAGIGIALLTTSARAADVTLTEIDGQKELILSLSMQDLATAAGTVVAASVIGCFAIFMLGVLLGRRA